MSKLRSDQNFTTHFEIPKNGLILIWQLVRLQSNSIPPLFLIEGGSNIYQTDTGYDPLTNGKDGF